MCQPLCAGFPPTGANLRLNEHVRVFPSLETAMSEKVSSSEASCPPVGSVCPLDQTLRRATVPSSRSPHHMISIPSLILVPVVNPIDDHALPLLILNSVTCAEVTSIQHAVTPAVTTLSAPVIPHTSVTAGASVVATVVVVISEPPQYPEGVQESFSVPELPSSQRAPSQVAFTTHEVEPGSPE